MDIWHVVVLSVVEGLTEFLPVSSTGHLILTSKLLNLPTTEFLKSFEIAIQLGAIMAVVALYMKKLTNIDLIKKLIVAFIPTAIVGFLLYPLIKGFLLGSSEITVWALFLGGLVLLFFDKDTTNSKPMTLRDAFIIGAFQSISVIPGVSRAAATIIGGLVVGLNRKSATEFSFLLAVPTMFAATGYDLYKSMNLFTSQNIMSLAIGFVLSFVFAVIAVKFLISYVQTHDFKVFGVYRIVLAVLFWILVM
jgi:undecaprenyl-diphosphatase